MVENSSGGAPKFKSGFPIQIGQFPQKSNRIPPVDFHERMAQIHSISKLVAIPNVPLPLISQRPPLGLSEMTPTTSWVVRTDSKRLARPPTTQGRSRCASRQLIRAEIFKTVSFWLKIRQEALQNLSRGSLYKGLKFRKKNNRKRPVGFYEAMVHIHCKT